MRARHAPVIPALFSRSPCAPSAHSLCALPLDIPGAIEGCFPSSRIGHRRPCRCSRLPPWPPSVRNPSLKPSSRRSNAMLTIYGVHRSRAARAIWLANELGVSFAHVPVVQRYRLSTEAATSALHTRSPDFLKVNPNGHIPTIEDDGLVLSESLAINLYLAKKHGGPLAPADLAEDALMTMWALWAATEVEPHSLTVLNHTVGKPPTERDPKLAQAAIEALRAPFAVLDRHLA